MLVLGLGGLSPITTVGVSAVLESQHDVGPGDQRVRDADVGAQISVPSVRGDKVLWMCGGHLQQGDPGQKAASARCERPRIDIA